MNRCFLCNIQEKNKWGKKSGMQTAQKVFSKNVMFVHTYLIKDGTIFNVKTPQYII